MERNRRLESERERVLSGWPTSTYVPMKLIKQSKGRATMQNFPPYSFEADCAKEWDGMQLRKGENVQSYMNRCFCNLNKVSHALT